MKVRRIYGSVITLLTAAFAIASWVPESKAQQPAVIIEDIQAPSVSLEAMDLLYEGDQIDLAANEAITLSYMRRCAIEHISSSSKIVIEIGIDRSLVDGKAKVNRKRIECSGASFELTENQSAQSAATVFRTSTIKDGNETMIYSLFPVFAIGAKTTGHLEIKEIEGSNQQFKFPIDGRHFDTGNSTLGFVGLRSGARYHVSAGGRSTTFIVSSTADASKRHVINRLVGF